MYCKRIENLVLQDGLKDMNKIVMEEPKDIAKIVDVCETLPCFSEKKLVILKNTSFFKAGKKESRSKKDDLEALIGNIPPYTCLVFCEKEVDKRLRLVKEVSKNGLVVEFKQQQQNVLIKWILGEAKRNKKIISVEACTKLVEYSDCYMFNIKQEMDKLYLYVGERQEVTVDDIEKVCTKSISVRIFDLINNIAIGNQYLALKNLKEMLILKEPVPKIMFMIIKQIRQLLELKTLLQEGLTLRDCVSIMKIAPYAGEKMAQQIRNFSMEKLKGILNEMLQLDYKVKTGEIKDIVAVEVLITKLCKKN